MNDNKITLNGKQKKALFNHFNNTYGEEAGWDGFEDEREANEVFHLEMIRCDYEEGSYDSGKSAMIEFPIEVRDINTGIIYQFVGGYYYDGYHWNNTDNFYEKEPEELPVPDDKDLLEKVTVYAICIDDQYGSYYIDYFLNAEDAAKANLNSECEPIETYVGSNAHDWALINE